MMQAMMCVYMILCHASNTCILIIPCTGPLSLACLVFIKLKSKSPKQIVGLLGFVGKVFVCEKVVAKLNGMI